MYITALILPSDIKKSNRSCCLKEWCQIFQAQSIAVVVTSRSSSLQYTMLVHAGSERNVCNTVVSTDTHQTTTNFAVKTDINSFVNSEDPNLLDSSETT